MTQRKVQHVGGKEASKPAHKSGPNMLIKGLNLLVHLFIIVLAGALCVAVLFCFFWLRAELAERISSFEQPADQHVTSSLPHNSTPVTRSNPQSEPVRTPVHTVEPAPTVAPSPENRSFPSSYSVEPTELAQSPSPVEQFHAYQRAQMGVWKNFFAQPDRYQGSLVNWAIQVTDVHTDTTVSNSTRIEYIEGVMSSSSYRVMMHKSDKSNEQIREIFDGAKKGQWICVQGTFVGVNDNDRIVYIAGRQFKNAGYLDGY